MFTVKTQESDGEWVHRGRATSLQRAMRLRVVKERQEAADVIYLFDEGDRIAATWVPDEEHDGEGKGWWAFGDAFAQGRNTVWTDFDGCIHTHQP